MPAKKAAPRRTTPKQKLVRGVGEYSPDPPEFEYVVLEGAEFPADDPVVREHPTFFEAVK